MDDWALKQVNPPQVDKVTRERDRLERRTRTWWVFCNLGTGPFTQVLETTAIAGIVGHGETAANRVPFQQVLHELE